MGFENSKNKDTINLTFDNIEDDPQWRELQDEITRVTNADPQVGAELRSGKTGTDAWERVNAREWHNRLRNFVLRYPEKALKYKTRWDAFVQDHPEVAQMNDDAWIKWCRSSPGTFREMSSLRLVGRAVKATQR